MKYFYQILHLFKILPYNINLVLQKYVLCRRNIRIVLSVLTLIFSKSLCQILFSLLFTVVLKTKSFKIFNLIFTGNRNQTFFIDQPEVLIFLF